MWLSGTAARLTMRKLSPRKSPETKGARGSAAQCILGYATAFQQRRYSSVCTTPSRVQEILLGALTPAACDVAGCYTAASDPPPPNQWTNQATP